MPAWVVRVFSGSVIATAVAIGLTSPVRDSAPGIASLLPIITTLVLVFITRDVLTSLLFGVVTGAFASANWNVIQSFLVPSVGSETYAVILLIYLWALGGLIGLWTRTGAAAYFADWTACRFIRGPRSAKVFTWVLGILFHQGGTTSVVLTGATVRALSENQRVSHEESAFIIDATGSPVAALIPLNVWPVLTAAFAVGTIPPLATTGDVVRLYFQAVPMNFYCVFIVAIALLVAMEWMPWEGRRLREARLRAKESGELDAPGAVPIGGEEVMRLQIPDGYVPSLSDFFVPLIVLLGIAGLGLVPAISAADLSHINIPISEAFALALVAAVLLALGRGMRLDDALAGVMDGIRGVTIGAVILALAVTLGLVIRTLGTGGYIVGIAQAVLQPTLLPVILLLTCAVISFATGSVTVTWAIVLPIAMPLTYAMSASPDYLTICFAAVMAGSVFGDHCSPIASTTILTSVAGGGDVLDHTLSQLPLGLLAIALAAGAFLLLGRIAV